MSQLKSSSAEEQLEVNMEMERLERLLDVDVEQWERRLADINLELAGRTRGAGDKSSAAAVFSMGPAIST